MEHDVFPLEGEGTWVYWYIGQWGYFFHCHIETMGVVEVLLVPFYEGTTHATEHPDRLLASRCRGFYDRGEVIDSNDGGHILLDWPLKERGTSQYSHFFLLASQHSRVDWTPLWSRHKQNGHTGADKKDFKLITKSDSVSHWADYRVDIFTSGFSCAHELCSSVLKCTNIWLEHHLIGLYEEAINRVLNAEWEEVQVWDYYLCFLLCESAQFQS